MVPATLLPHLYQLLEAWACSRRWCPEQRLGMVQNRRRAFKSDVLYLDSSLDFSIILLTRWMTATSDTTYLLLATPTLQPPYRTTWGRGQTQQAQTVKSYGSGPYDNQPYDGAFKKGLFCTSFLKEPALTDNCSVLAKFTAAVATTSHPAFILECSYCLDWKWLFSGWESQSLSPFHGLLFSAFLSGCAEP